MVDPATGMPLDPSALGATPQTPDVKKVEMPEGGEI